MLCETIIGILATTALVYSTGMLSYLHEKFAERYPVVDLIARHLDMKLVRNFAVFQIRRLAREHLESGLLVSNRNHYDLIYYNDVNRYRVVFKKKRGPTNVWRVLHGEGTDAVNVSADVFECMGPSHNFHDIPTTPSMLGYDSLTFIMKDGNNRHFYSEDVIEIN